MLFDGFRKSSLSDEESPVHAQDRPQPVGGLVLHAVVLRHLFGVHQVRFSSLCSFSVDVIVDIVVAVCGRLWSRWWFSQPVLWVMCFRSTTPGMISMPVLLFPYGVRGAFDFWRVGFAESPATLHTAAGWRDELISTQHTFLLPRLNVTQLQPIVCDSRPAPNPPK